MALLLAPHEPYQVAFVAVHAAGVLGVEVGLQRIVRLDAAIPRGRAAIGSVVFGHRDTRLLCNEFQRQWRSAGKE